MKKKRNNMTDAKGELFRARRTPLTRFAGNASSALRLAALGVIVGLIAIAFYASTSASSNSSTSKAVAARARAAKAVTSKDGAIIDKAELNIGRRGHTATELDDGNVLVAGGENHEGLVRRAELLDSASGRFTLGAKMKTSRKDHAATRLADGRVLVSGGSGDGPLDSTEVFDPATGKFTRGLSMMRARAGHTATRLADGRVLIVGGDAEGTAEIFDPASQSFSLVGARLASKRAFHSAALLKGGKVLVAGGSVDNNAVDTAEIFDPEQMSFSAAGSMRSARVRPVLNVLPDGKVQVIGGDDEKTMEMFNAEGQYFTARAHLVVEPDAAAAVSKVLSTQSRAALIHKRDGQEVSAQSTAPLLEGELDREGHSLTDMPRAGRAIVAGGANGKGETLKSVVILASSTATVTTDKTDYQPGDVVTITGEGWQAGETVTMNLHREPTTASDTALTAVADGNGNFTNSQYTVQESDLDVTFTLTATGQSSGRTAQTTFTDASCTPSQSFTQSGAITTIDVADLTPDTAFQGATNVPMMYFSISASASSGGQDFQMACITYTGTNVNDISAVKLYRESNPTFAGSPIMNTATFDPSTDVLLATATMADVNNKFCLDPNYVIPGNSANCCRQTFYIAVDIKPTATVNNKVDVRVEPGELTFPTGQWPPCSQANTYNRAGDTTIVAAPNADLSVTKTDSPDPVVAGQNITYTITVTNVSATTAAANVQLSDTIPANTTFQSVTTPAGWTRTDMVGMGGTGTITFTKASVAAMESATFTLVVKVNANTANGATISNTATATTTTSEPNPETNPDSATATTAVITQADLSVIKTDSPDPVIAGQNITYTITVTNNGPSDAQNAQLSDTIPTGTTLVSFTPPAGWTRTDMVAVGGTGTVTATIATLPAGSGPQVFTLVVNVNSSVPEGSTISNTATVSSSTAEPNPDPNPNSATATTAVIARADLSVTKTDSPDPVLAGGNVTYTITVTNNGPSDAQNVLLSDALPANTTPVSFTQTASPPFALAFMSNTFSASTTSFSAGATATFTIVVKVNCSAANGSTTSNTANVSSTTTDPGPGPNSATATTTVSNPFPVFATACPAPITAVTAPGCPPRTGVVVNFARPTASDQNACPVSVVCSPDTGTTFPVGTTTVTCTATDAANQSISCSFNVTVFNACIQSDSNPNVVILFNTFTGDYVACCGTLKLTGRGRVIQQGCIFTLDHNATDRRVMAKIDFTTRTGNGSVQMPAGTTRCTISDGNITNNTCNCSLPAPPM